jgi:hypothetical protein
LRRGFYFVCFLPVLYRSFYKKFPTLSNFSEVAIMSDDLPIENYIFRLRPAADVVND